MSIINALKSHLSAKKQTTFETYIALLERANTSQDGDAESLAAIMNELGISVEQVQTDMGSVAVINEAMPHIRKQGERMNAKRAADAALTSHTTETLRLVRKIQDERLPKHDELARQLQNAANEVNDSTNAQRAIDDNAGQYKRLYPSDPIGRFR